MAKTVKGARFVLKRTDVPGSSPTVPPNNDHTTGWIDTDIYEGELFLNVYDDKMWFRDTNDDMIGLVPLNSGGTIDISYLPGNYMGAMIYQGVWDASSGTTPSSAPEKGDYWIVSVSGNTDLDGITDWQIGDFPVFNGLTWDKIDNSEPNILATEVIYTHTYYSGLTNVAESLDFLLDEYNEYSGGTNINITSGTHTKTISVVNAPTFSGNVTAATLIAQTGGLTVNGGGASITGAVGINGNLTMTGTGTITAVGTITTPGNINTSGSGTMSTSTLTATSGRLNLTTSSNYILGDGTGIRLYHANNLKLDINGTAQTTSYNKLTYDVAKAISNNNDIVYKEWVDTQIGLHSPYWWSIPSTYKATAYDIANTMYVGVNVADPIYPLHVVGATYLNGTTTHNGVIEQIIGGSTYLYNDASTTMIGDGDNGDFLFIDSGMLSYKNQVTTFFSINTLGGDISTFGTVNVGGGLTVDGSIDLGTDASDELILRGTHVTIANIGGTDDINLMFASSAAFGNQTIGIEPTSSTNGKALYIKGQGSSSAIGQGGAVGIYGGSSANDDGGVLTLNGGPGGSGSGDKGGTIYVQGGSGYEGGDVVINGANGTGGVDGKISIGTSNTTGIHSNQSTFPIATPGANEVLFIDSDNQIKRGTAGGGAVTTYTNGSNDRVVTSTGTAGINGEANLRFSGTNLSLYSSVTENIRITNAGTIHAGADIIAYSATIPSDIRLKKNIKTLENSLDKVLNLRGVSYEWKNKEGNQVGFIADEMIEIIPDSVKEILLPLISDDGIMYKTIKYTEIIPYLVESIKELKAEIEELKTK